MKRENFEKIASALRKRKCRNAVMKAAAAKRPPASKNSEKILKIAFQKRAADARRAAMAYRSGMALVSAGRAMMKRAADETWRSRWLDDKGNPKTDWFDQNEHPGLPGNKQTYYPVLPPGFDPSKPVDSEVVMLDRALAWLRENGYPDAYEGQNPEGFLNIPAQETKAVANALARAWVANGEKARADYTAPDDAASLTSVLDAGAPESWNPLRGLTAEQNAQLNAAEHPLETMHAAREAGMSTNSPESAALAEAAKKSPSTASAPGTNGRSAAAAPEPFASVASRHPVYTGAGVGAGTGAIAGLLYEALRGRKKDEEKSYALKAVLGALLGAAAGGLAGKYAPGHVSDATKRVAGV